MWFLRIQSSSCLNYFMAVCDELWEEKFKLCLTLNKQTRSANKWMRHDLFLTDFWWFKFSGFKAIIEMWCEQVVIDHQNYSLKESDEKVKITTIFYCSQYSLNWIKHIVEDRGFVTLHFFHLNFSIFEWHVYHQSCFLYTNLHEEEWSGNLFY